MVIAGFSDLERPLLSLIRRRTQGELLADFEKAWDEGKVGAREAAELAVDWTWNDVAKPPELLRIYMVMSWDDEVFAALRAKYDRYKRAALARLLEKIMAPHRASTARAAATVVDVVVETLAIWSRLHPGGSRELREATKELVARYIGGGG